MNAAPIDLTTPAPRTAVQCSWCGLTDDDGAVLNLYGTIHEGQTFWSDPLCSIDCHDEAFSEVQS